MSFQAVHKESTRSAVLLCESMALLSRSMVVFNKSIAVFRELIGLQRNNVLSFNTSMANKHRE